MNTELLNVLNKKIKSLNFLDNCHGILVRMKEICCRQLLLRKNGREDRSFVLQ